MTVLKKYRKLVKTLRHYRTQHLKKHIQTVRFAEQYLRFSLFILIASTVLWSLVSASIHMTNADQLVSPYMFDSVAVFKNATFPGQHTFLFKWPVFWLVHALDSTTFAYTFFTVILSLATVGAFAYLLSKIEKRPLVLGTLILALSGTLLLVPAQAAPGMLLPVNFGMITNRNVEYILLFAGVIAILKSTKIKSRLFVSTTVILALLTASDRLFLSISVAGAGIGLTAVTLAKKWRYSSAMARFTLSSIAGGILGSGILFLIDSLHITSIAQQTTATYSINHSAHTLVLNLFYACSGILTNFGANLAVHTTTISQMPREALRTLFSFGGPLSVLNLAVFLVALLASIKLFAHILRRKTTGFSLTYAVFIGSFCVALAALAAFVLTDHYAAGDSRYLTVFLFALFIGLTAYLRDRHLNLERLVYLGGALTTAILLATPSVFANARLSKQVMAETNRRNSLIVDALKSHHVNILLGDYWRVLPIRQASSSKLDVMPLSDCTTARDVLSSLSWQPNMQQVSFAYILTTDKGLTDYPSCTLDDITTAYGKPNASIVIAGTQDDPKEQLLFYDHGAHKSSPKLGSDTTATSPLSTEELPNTSCSKSTRFNIVAHEDDDLLFMNPSIQTELNQGTCVRTIYLTAGDAGSNQFYWLSREQGSEAAYNHMIGYDALWVHRTVKLADKQYITVANPRGNPRVSLIFFRLPDGNLQGGGFSGYGYESLQKLYDGSINSIRSVYGDSNFTKETLIDAILRLMQLYGPSSVHTQSTWNEPPLHDHSDHIATAHFTDAAYQHYISGSSAKAELTTLSHYAGYSVRNLPENVHGEDLHRKTESFLRYAQHDSGVCHSHDECEHTPTYGGYLKRQYLTD